MSEIVPFRTPPTVRTLLPSVNETERLTRLAKLLADTDFIPKAIRGNPPAILAAILTGRELGIAPMRSLRQVSIVDGKPSPAAELMLALALDAGHDVRVTVTTHDRCVVRVHRREWAEGDYSELEWTVEDAVRAGLCSIDPDTGRPKARSSYGKPLPWEQYTRAMLRSRAVSEACRAWLPDVVEGASYVPEEVGADVDGDGHDPELGLGPLDGLPEELATAAQAAYDGPGEEDAVVVCQACGTELDSEGACPNEPHDGGDAAPEPDPEPTPDVPVRDVAEEPTSVDPVAQSDNETPVPLALVEPEPTSEESEARAYDELTSATILDDLRTGKRQARDVRRLEMGREERGAGKPRKGITAVLDRMAGDVDVCAHGRPVGVLCVDCRALADRSPAETPSEPRSGAQPAETPEEARKPGNESGAGSEPAVDGKSEGAPEPEAPITDLAERRELAIRYKSAYRDLFTAAPEYAKSVHGERLRIVGVDDDGFRTCDLGELVKLVEGIEKLRETHVAY